MSPSVGTNVQFICPNDGEPRAAVVTQVFDYDGKTVNLLVFRDGTRDFADIEQAGPVFIQTSVMRGEERNHWRPIPRDGPEKENEEV